MSIPADFRRVLEDGDPRCPENPNPRLVVLYGPHLRNRLQAYTIDGMAEIEKQIESLPRGSRQRKMASFTILAKSWETEVDKDGRIVLPIARRRQIGLEGEATFVAMGDHFEIWNAQSYAESAAAEVEAWLAEQGEDFDPMSLLDGA